MKRIITIAATALVALFVGAGLASADTMPEPEPAGSCYGVKPICIGSTACCTCNNSGFNCSWSCCR